MANLALVTIDTTYFNNKPEIEKNGSVILFI